MQKDTTIIKGAKDQDVYVRHYSGVGATKGVVQVLHGMSEHGGNYEGLARFLVENGYSVYVQDHRKHGKSISGDQKVGYYTDDTWEDMVDDIKCVQKYILENDGTDNLILLGHSMGSFLCRNYLMTYGDRVSKAVIIGTADANTVISKLGIFLSKILQKTSGDKTSAFLHHMSIGQYNNVKEFDKKENAWLSRDPAAVEKYNNDEGCGFPYTPRFYGEIAKGVYTIQKKDNIAKTPKIPLYFIAGDRDPVGRFGEGVKKVIGIYEELGYDVTKDFVEGGRHDVLNETNQDEVRNKILGFIEG